MFINILKKQIFGNVAYSDVICWFANCKSILYWLHPIQFCVIHDYVTIHVMHVLHLIQLVGACDLFIDKTILEM